MRKLIKNTIEDFRRLKMKNNIFSFKYNNEKINFYLPHKRDYIQQQILFRNKFYENKTLQKVSKFIKDDFTFLDIGSNIGNHIIYFTKILNAKKVYGFEPQKDVFKILEKNIEINNISDKVNIFNIGLGDEKTTASIEYKYKYNSGANLIKVNDNGDIPVKKLDNMNIKDKIDFIKIDTEGFEKQVLIGGNNLIKNNLPIMWVEISKNKEFILRFLRDLKYNNPIKLDNNGNYLFVINPMKEKEGEQWIG